MVEDVLTLNGVACGRGGQVILEDVAFTVPPGEAVLLRGPNGSGKTTLLRTIAGLQPALCGDVQTPDDGVAYAAHADGVKATLTVAENLQFWAGLFGQNEIAPALQKLALSDLADRPANALSAGQKRRLGLARVVVTQCPLWVMDEPTVSLDAASVELLGQVIDDHLSNGGAAVISTHVAFGQDWRTIDVTQFAPKTPTVIGFDEAFL